MEQQFQQSAEQTAAFQKIWTDTATKLFQTAFTATPNSPPPEVLRQLRSGIFQALAQSWDEFMRSPQFLQNMKQWMENAISFRKLTNDFMARVRNDVQAPSREDIDSVMLTVRHMEKRILDRMEELSKQVESMKAQKGANGSRTAAAPRKTPKTTRRGNRKEPV